MVQAKIATHKAGDSEQAVFTLNVGGKPTIFSKFKTSDDRDAVIHATLGHHPAMVVMVDAGVGPAVRETIAAFRANDIMVVIRDHNDLDGEPVTPRDIEIRAGADSVRALMSPGSRLSNHRFHPRCSDLIEPGEFENYEQVVFVADMDTDGLNAVLKAVGIEMTPEQTSWLQERMKGRPGKDKPILHEQATQAIFEDLLAKLRNPS